MPVPAFRPTSACAPAASLTLPRGRAGATGPNVHVVNYRHVIHSLKKKPMALLNLIYRDAMFPREPYRRCFERALERLTQREACRLTVTLLALAHEENCEAELATAIEGVLKAGRLPDPDKLKPRFAPDPAEMPRIDAVKLSMMLNELRLPTINQLWQSFAKAGRYRGLDRGPLPRRTRRARARRAWQKAHPAPSRGSPPGWPARTSPPSTSMPCRRSPRPRSARWPPATHGSPRAPTPKREPDLIRLRIAQMRCWPGKALW